MTVSNILITFCVVTLGPVVSSSTLSKHKVVRSEDLTEGAGPDAVHGAGLKINQHGLEILNSVKFRFYSPSSSSGLKSEMAGIF